MDQDPATAPPLDPEDFYLEEEAVVFTAAYHLKRGYCCDSGCRHCPYCKMPTDNHEDDPC